MAERLLIRDCSAFTDYEKMNRDESVLEYIHCLIDMAYEDTITDSYVLDVDFFTSDCSDRFYTMVDDSGLLTVPGNSLERFNRCSFRFCFTGGSRNLFVTII
jgi:hypothetical protein